MDSKTRTKAHGSMSPHGNLHDTSANQMPGHRDDAMRRRDSAETTRRPRLSYMWRIFIPTAAMVWLLMGGIMLYQYKREADYRAEAVKLQLDIINKYVVNAYKSQADLTPILSFLSSYLDNTVYDKVRVSIYDPTGHLLDFIGAPIPKLINGLDPATESNVRMNHTDFEDSGMTQLYYYATARSKDASIYVRTGMPYDVSLNDALSLTRGWWIFVLCLGCGCTLIVFMATRMLSRNITLLQDFAQRAASGQPLDRLYEFPHDELGDISRQIVSLYRSRLEAVSDGEREHRIALHAVEEKARIKNQLTNNINHELKTPIGIIKGYIDTILSDPSMPEATKNKFLERTQSNIDRLCLMLNDVSTMTRLEEGGEKIPVTEVDLHDLVFQIHSDFKQASLHDSMRFTYDIPLGCMVKGNSNVLSSMLSNLVRNAELHSHGTEISFRLIGENDRFYIFSFADDGQGVPAESLPHLFERFYRVDSGRSRKAGGSGLGLPIVKNVVVVLGGAISVRNRTTGGLEFIFTLPKWQG